MNSLEELKQELLSQKQLIEEGGGYVVVGGTNPSPSEITEGIKTIVGVDLSIATATEDDVRLGKTFFAGDTGLKTGRVSMDTNFYNHIFMVEPNTQSTEEDLYFTCPVDLIRVRKYMFENNLNKIHFKFNESLKYIREYAFYNTKNFVFEDFSNMNQLERISMYAFADSSGDGLDFGNMPNTLVALEEYCFNNTLYENCNVVLPPHLTSCGQSVFRMSERTMINSFSVQSEYLSAFGNYMLYNVACNCDFTVPTKIKSIPVYFNHNGCFHNIVIPSGTKLQNYAFGASTSKPYSDFFLKTVTFEGESPTTVGTAPFAYQNIQNGFKIYVPDNSIEAYKAVTNLSAYSECIYPMSEKD